MSGLKFHPQKSTEHFKQRKTHKNIGHLKTDNWPQNSIPSLQSILSLNVKDSLLSSDNCVITLNVQSKNSEPQTTITIFNINEISWRLFKPIEAWKKVINPNWSQSVEAITEDFYKKNQNFFKNYFKKFPRALAKQSITKIKRQKRTILLNIQKKQSRALPHPMEKNQSRIQNSSPKEPEGRLGKICQHFQQQYTYVSR